MLYLTDFSTASKMLNLNNPIQETVRFRSVGSGITLLLSVPKMKKSQWLFDNGVQRSGESNDIETIWQKSVIGYIRALTLNSYFLILNVVRQPIFNFQLSTFNFQLSTFPLFSVSRFGLCCSAAAPPRWPSPPCVSPPAAARSGCHRNPSLAPPRSCPS